MFINQLKINRVCKILSGKATKEANAIQLWARIAFRERVIFAATFVLP
jgi:hypothetical protein